MWSRSWELLQTCAKVIRLGANANLFLVTRIEELSFLQRPKCWCLHTMITGTNGRQHREIQSQFSVILVPLAMRAAWLHGWWMSVTQSYFETQHVWGKTEGIKRQKMNKLVSYPSIQGKWRQKHNANQPKTDITSGILQTAFAYSRSLSALHRDNTLRR